MIFNAPTSDLKGAINQIPNPNLLDNWYFVGGGSQQGGGQFPINQRGQTSYTNAGYTIDRWRLNDSSGGIDVSSNGMVAHSGSTIMQQLPANDLVGKKVTATLLMSNNIAITGTATLVASGAMSFVSDQGVYLFAWGDTGVNTISFVINITSSANITILAAKLEIGSNQTLIHNENGTWVLNEIPNYGEELAKCQRYFIDPNRTGLNPLFVTQFVASKSDTISLNLMLPVTMRATPTLTLTSNTIRNQNDGTTQTIDSFMYNVTPVYLGNIFGITGATLTPGVPYGITYTLSADL